MKYLAHFVMMLGLLTLGFFSYEASGQDFDDVQFWRAMRALHYAMKGQCHLLTEMNSTNKTLVAYKKLCEDVKKHEKKWVSTFEAETKKFYCGGIINGSSSCTLEQFLDSVGMLTAESAFLEEEYSNNPEDAIQYFSEALTELQSDMKASHPNPSVKYYQLVSKAMIQKSILRLTTQYPQYSVEGGPLKVEIEKNLKEAEAYLKNPKILEKFNRCCSPNFMDIFNQFLTTYAKPLAVQSSKSLQTLPKKN